MKTLYIVRHGKSSWEGSVSNDFERPLLSSGEQRTLMIAKYLVEQNVIPDLIVSSHAIRAFDTACLIAASLKYPRHKIQIESQLYNKGPESIYDLIYTLPEDKDKVLLVGHNPSLTRLVNDFLERQIDILPTSGIVSVSFYTNHWNEIATAGKKVNFVVFPKNLENSH